MQKKLFTILLFLLSAIIVNAQEQDHNIPERYFKKIDNKIDCYAGRLESKTRKTLKKLIRWEDKIFKILQRVSPETANRLFAKGEPTFKTLLEKFDKGTAIAEDYKNKYDSYKEKLATNFKYIKDKKHQLDQNINKASAVYKDLCKLDTIETNTETVQQFIRDRKRQLIKQSMQVIGKSKYLKKLNKECYYYSETLRNYREIFSDEKKIEETASKLLRKIPGFENFASQNSSFSGLFSNSLATPSINTGTSYPIVNGLPNRAMMQEFMQVNVPTVQLENVGALMKGKVSDLKAELDRIKGYASGGNSNNDGLPDFKPNSQKAKPFWKRLEYITDFQFGNSNQMIPSNLKTALGIGYKFTDKYSAGFAMSYVLGMGMGWDNIKLTHQGLGFRTYLKLKLKKSFAMQGGSEWDYHFERLKQSNNQELKPWQQTALLGISKSITASKKAKGNFQIYYDFLHNKHNPTTSAFVFRYGYSFGN